MSLKLLWTLLRKVSQTRSFQQLCVEEGFQVNRRNNGVLIVGVDASALLSRSQAIVSQFGHTQSDKNAELQVLFFELARLCDTAATVVFVFNSEPKPKCINSERKLIVQQAFQRMIAAFGYYYYVAPGKAVPELATLNRLDMIDAVLTDPGDTVPFFGATQMIRRLDSDCPDTITVYTAQAFEENPALGIKWGGLLLVAMLVGTDNYNTGVNGCGINIALGLAQCGFGDRLLEAAQTLSEGALQQFAVLWRQQLCAELATNSQGNLKSRYPTLATAISPQFPDLQVLAQYVNPATSWSGGHNPPDNDKWIAALPNLPELGLYCSEKFGWSAKDIGQTFKESVFPGLCVRRLFMPYDQERFFREYAVYGRVNEEHPPLSAYMHVHRSNIGPPPATLKTYLMKICIGFLYHLTTSRLADAASFQPSKASMMTHFIPAPLAERLFMGLVATFYVDTCSMPVPVPQMPLASLLSVAACSSTNDVYVVDLTTDDDTEDEGHSDTQSTGSGGLSDIGDLDSECEYIVVEDEDE